MILEELTKEFLRTDLPKMSIGDTVKVYQRIIEGNKERLQAFEGVVIAQQGGGIHETFCVRKISNNEGVEKVFLLHSPMIGKIEVISHGKVRRAKLYYLRDSRKKMNKIARIRSSSKKTA
ncbi:MAG TPA: 50S ribosomal protein L19 [Caldisericia bacterium]|jgi:large subunit ribosomal protein L19|nr:50S ribosomal protein L19 [Caldisericia bacterium]